MLPKNRRPTTPGEILKYEFLFPLGMTQVQLAAAIGITRVRIKEIILRKRSPTLDTAFRLAQYFNTTPDFWLGLQMDVDMWDTLQRNAGEYKKIRPFKSALRLQHSEIF
jgi:addiction module HigA family antidote